VNLYRQESVESGTHWLGARVWLGLAGVAALIFVAGGPVALAVAVVACAACLAWPAFLARPPRRPAGGDPVARLPLLALAAMAVSGLLSAVRPFGEGLFGPFGWPAQLCALVALAAALIPARTIPARTIAALPPAGTSAGEGT
jgi:hypothetical protein